METLTEIHATYLLDCTQPELCDCLSCDAARRDRVRTFAERWFAEQLVDEQSGIRTVRPPAMSTLTERAA